MHLILNCVLLSVFITGTLGAFECAVDTNCGKGAKCTKNFCECLAGFVMSLDGAACHKMSIGIERPCQIDGQCAVVNGPVQCLDGKCQCAKDHVYLRRTCIRRLMNEASCEKTEDCFDGLDFSARKCTGGKCQCSEGYYNRDGYSCRRKAGLGDVCAMNHDCQDKNAFCQRNICVVDGARGQYPINSINPTKTPARLLGETVVSNEIGTATVLGGIDLNELCVPGEVCKDPNALCSPATYTCLCKNGFHQKGKKPTCVGELGNACTANEHCSSNICDEETHVCSCKIGQIIKEDYTLCRKGPEQDGDVLKCSTDTTCRLLLNNYYCHSNPETRKKYCRCKPGYTLSEYFVCEDSCSSNKDCTKPHEMCDLDESKCVCEPGYALFDSLCKPVLGGACDASEDCMIANATCDKEIGQCACSKKFVNHNGACYPDVAIGEECLHNVQCFWRWNSTCTRNNDRKTCECDKGFKNINGSCLKIAERVGDYCTHPSVCMTETICEKSKCTCLLGLTPSKDKLRCVENTIDDGSAAAALTAPTILTLCAIFLAAFCNLL